MNKLIFYLLIMLVVIGSASAAIGGFFGINGQVNTPNTKYLVTNKGIMNKTIEVENVNNFSVYVMAKPQNETKYIFHPNNITLLPGERYNFSYSIIIDGAINKTFKAVFFFSKNETSSGVGIPNIIRIESVQGLTARQKQMNMILLCIIVVLVVLIAGAVFIERAIVKDEKEEHDNSP